MNKNEIIKELLDRLIKSNAAIDNVTDSMDKESHNYLILTGELVETEYLIIKVEAMNNSYLEQFNRGFNKVDPKQMVTFVEFYRTGKLYAFDTRDGSNFLVDEQYSDTMLAMINSGDYLFGTKKEKESPAQKIEEARAYLKSQGYFMDSLWSLEDIVGKAQEMDLEVSENQAKEIMESMGRYHDAEIGINWEVIEARITEYFEQ